MKHNIFEYERAKAIDILVKLGAVKYVKDMELYHGRAGDGRDWEVDPNFNNGGNSTGNKNVYSVSGLYSGEYDIAKAFAEKRVKHGDGKIAEVHKIVSNIDDAIIFDLSFNEKKLSKNNQNLYYSALETLCSFGVSQGSPIKYEYKDAYPIVLKTCQEIQHKYNVTTISEKLAQEAFVELKKYDDIRKIFQKPSALEEFLHNFIGAYNAKRLLMYAPRFALDNYIDGSTEFQYSNSKEYYPFNSSFVSAWCARNNVVGISQKVDSATLGKVIPSAILFDTKRIMSEKQHGEMLQNLLSRYGEIIKPLQNIVDTDMQELFVNGSSQEIMQFVKKSPMCKALYDKSAYIWEGWTIGQHTESVIDFFDRFYSDEIPDEIKPFIKIVMLAHDIGKGYAKENNLSQNYGNLLHTKHLYSALNIDKKYGNLIDYIISKSQDITSAILLNKGDKKVLKDNLRKGCYNEYYKAFDRYPSEEEINALMKICIVLQTCDSGSYTRYSHVRVGNKTVSGANDSFTKSFIINERGVPRIKVFEEEGM